MKDIKVEKASIQEILISAKAVYYNPNVMGVRIDHSDVDVIANGFEVGKIDIPEPEKIRAKNTFEIPIEISFPPAKILERESGLLSGLLTSYLDRQIELEYKGHITMDIGGIKFDVPVEHQETIDLRRIK